MKKLLLGLTLFVLLICTQVSGANARTLSSECPVFTSGTLCSETAPFCGDDCDNTPFCPTTCWPTDDGPAWAGGDLASNYLLYCETGTYANCHYSGPPYVTGSNSDNIALPCSQNVDGTATCKCEIYEGVNYVNLGAILNLGAYYETIAVCGEDGSQCKNLENCPPGTENCPGADAPVCKYITGQDPHNPATSLIPGYDLISTFGLEMGNDYYTTGQMTQCGEVTIAGCMTAPCYYDDADHQYAQCICPTAFKQSYTLSQGGQQCDIGPQYVWE